MLVQLPRHAAQNRPSRLVVAADAAWFQVDDGPAVSLATRTSLRLLLAALVDLHGTGAGVLSSADAFAAGWPGERALAKSAATRVYTAIHTLRRFGLGDAIRRRGTGYALFAEVIVVDGAAMPETPASAVRIALADAAIEDDAPAALAS